LNEKTVTLVAVFCGLVQSLSRLRRGREGTEKERSTGVYTRFTYGDDLKTGFQDALEGLWD